MTKKSCGYGLLSAICGVGIAITSWFVLFQTMPPFQSVLLTVCLAVFCSVIILSLIFLSIIKKETYNFNLKLDKIFCLGNEDFSEENLNGSIFESAKPVIQRFIKDIKTTNTDVMMTGDCIAIGAAEISFFLDELKSTINKNATHANQISVASEEITQTTSVISETVKSVSDVVSNARAYSDEGTNEVESINKQIHLFMDSVKETAKDARYLRELSGKIQSITQVIDSVAEQTNLLALNAAIEAARAGEHGRGFAVVADEVRTLANQTTTATTEIGQMLNEVQQQTDAAVQTMTALEDGVSSVVSISDSAKQTFLNIHSSSLQTEEKINEIDSIIKGHVTATREISSSVGGISQQMEETGVRVDKVVQEGYLLSETGEKINSLLSKYKLGTIHEVYRNIAITTADTIAKRFMDSIEKGEISEGDLFDRDYQPISGTNPTKFSTKFDSYTDRVLPSIQEPILVEHSDILFAGAVDSNGYFPTHNKRYSQALTGDYEKDLNNNRTKRLFNDRTGSRCGSNKERFLLQTYKRDTGVVIHDISAPIFINDKHWGGFRIGYKSA